MRNRQIFKTFITFGVIIVLVWLLSYFLGFETHSNPVLVLILSIVFTILCLLINGINKTLKKYKDKSGIIISLSLISACVFILGLAIFIIGFPITKNYNTISVEVVDTTWNTVTVDYSIYNHGDEKEITIRKPFCVHLNQGDVIFVRYDDNPLNMYYVANFDIGEKLISTSIYMFEIICAIVIIMLIIYVIKRNKKRME